VGRGNHSAILQNFAALLIALGFSHRFKTVTLADVLTFTGISAVLQSEVPLHELMPPQCTLASSACTPVVIVTPPAKQCSGSGGQHQR